MAAKTGRKINPNRWHLLFAFDILPSHRQQLTLYATTWFAFTNCRRLPFVPLNPLIFTQRQPLGFSFAIFRQLATGRWYLQVHPHYTMPSDWFHSPFSTSITGNCNIICLIMPTNHWCASLKWVKRWFFSPQRNTVLLIFQGFCGWCSVFVKTPIASFPSGIWLPENL